MNPRWRAQIDLREGVSFDLIVAIGEGLGDYDLKHQRGKFISNLSC
jgi:hypothetical protein